MKARINKLINYKGKEYAHIIEKDPAPFCDFCVFSDLCTNVLKDPFIFEDSPMKICEDLCDEANTTYGFFINSDGAENYIKHINNENRND